MTSNAPQVVKVDKTGTPTHPRVVIRDHIKSLLRGKTVAKNNVYTNRRNVIWGEQEYLPAIIINTQDESIEPVNGPKNYPRLMTHRMTVRIDIFAQGPEDCDDDSTVDDLCDMASLQVEKIMSRYDDRFDRDINADFETHGFRLENCIITGMQHIVETDAEVPFASVQLFYSIEYEAHDGYGPATISGEAYIDFEGLDIEVRTQPPDNPAQDDKEMDIKVDVPTS